MAAIRDPDTTGRWTQVLVSAVTAGVVAVLVSWLMRPAATQLVPDPIAASGPAVMDLQAAAAATAGDETLDPVETPMITDGMLAANHIKDGAVGVDADGLTIDERYQLVQAETSTFYLGPGAEHPDAGKASTMNVPEIQPDIWNDEAVAPEAPPIVDPSSSQEGGEHAPDA